MVQKVKYAVKRKGMDCPFFFFHALRARKVYKSRLDDRGEWKIW
jgi:hypothetical protein